MLSFFKDRLSAKMLKMEMTTVSSTSPMESMFWEPSLGALLM